MSQPEVRSADADADVDILPIDAADVVARAEGAKRRRATTKPDGVGERQRLKQERQDVAREGSDGDQDLDDCRLGFSTIIRIEPDEVRVNDKAICMLAKNEPSLFQRSHSLVRILLASTKSDTGPKIGEVKRATLREMIASSATWLKFSPPQERWLPSHPPDWCVDAVHARGTWAGIRSLAGLVEAPTLRPDGSVLDAPGYDYVTELFYVPPAGVEFLPVPEAPTRDDAIQALIDLNEVIVDFPFVGESAVASDNDASSQTRIGAHRSAALAMLLTLCIREAVSGNIPLFLVEAPEKGTGKTLLLEVFSLIAFGRSLARSPYPSDEAELSKTLTALAIEGAATIFFDNIGKGQTLGCPVLDALLTAPVYKARVLGVSQTVEIPFRPIVLATGNNVDLGSDTTRRVLLVRLEAQDADPSKRATWRHPNLLGWVRQERPRLHRAALTIMKAYFQAGCPVQPIEAWGSYTEWSSLVRGSLVWAGAADPGKVRDTIADAASDLDRALLALVLDGLRNHTPKTASELCRLVETPGTNDPELRDALSQMAGHGGRLSPHRVAKRLRELRGKVVQAGARHEQLVMDTKSSKGTLWSVGVLPGPRGADTGVSAGAGPHRDLDAARRGVAADAARPADARATSEWEGL